MSPSRDVRHRDAGPTGLFTGRSGFRAVSGASRGSYASLNLGLNVGDDPEVVRDNRTALAGELGLEPDRLVFMGQVHGTNIAMVQGPTAATIQGTDGLVTGNPGLALAVLVADCVPVLARDARTGISGAAHAGRLGAAAGIGPALIARMVECGADLARVQIVLGPAICGRCYEVPADMRDDVDARLPGSACETADGTPGLDLRAGLSRQFRAIGVGTVEIDERCTREDPEFFSHRRSAPTGRFAGLIGAIHGLPEEGDPFPTRN